MGYLDNVVPIEDLGQRKLVVLWGKSNTGKTLLGSTWPKPMLYAQIGDDGSNTIRDVKGVKGTRIEDLKTAKGLLEELISKKGAGYSTVFFDTFSMLTNTWIDENVVKKKKKMTQQMWGDLKTDTEEIIRLAWKLSLHTWVILSCHEAMDTVEGMEDEILPDARPNTTRGARTYLEGMANYGFHTTRLKKTVIKDGVEKDLVKYAAHIGPNPYYWTKLQTPKGTKVPSVMTNPSFSKLQELGLMGGEVSE
jgi:hypothetical protein